MTKTTAPPPVDLSLDMLPAGQQKALLDNVFKNRIIGFKVVKLGDINHNPRQWKTHPDSQKGTLRGILDEVGFAGVPVVYNSVRTGGLTYVDGHGRKETAPDQTTWVAITDLTDEEADFILATFDLISQQALPIPEKFADLMESINTGSEAVQAMLSQAYDRVVLPGLEPPEDPVPPEDFQEYGEDLETEYCCPKCGYEWSGSPN